MNASDGTATKLIYGAAPKSYYPEKCTGDFDFTGGSFVLEPTEPNGVLDVPVAPGSPRVPYWPNTAGMGRNTHAKYCNGK